MATWAELEAELDRWRQAGERPTFFWRDDDTEAPTDALTRLIALTARHGALLHLAVIPAGIDPALAGYLGPHGHVLALQHGLAHRNHEPKGKRASEIGQSRALDLIRADLAEGWQRLQDAGLPRIIPVLAPPWNRIGAQVVPHLASWGYLGLSCFDRRPNPAPAGKLKLLPGHVEPLRWRPDAIFAGTEKTLAQCVTHLRERRTGIAEKDEPTGIVTHHLQTPEAAWQFCDALAERLNHDARVDWLRLDSLLKEA